MHDPCDFRKLFSWIYFRKLKVLSVESNGSQALHHNDNVITQRLAEMVPLDSSNALGNNDVMKCLLLSSMLLQ